jgi:undecaprenyl-diphosphatase
VFLLLVLVIAAAALLALTIVAREAVPDQIDVGATRWLQQWNAGWLASSLYAVSWPGFGVRAWILALVVAIPFAWRVRLREGMWVIGTQIAAPINLLVKQIVHRDRPSADLVQVVAQLQDYSFPSGHTVQYTVLFGFAFFLVYVLAPRSRWRTVVLAICLIPIVLVGPSRMYLGQHWLSDVLGGYALGTLVLVPYCLAYTRWTLAPRDGVQ